MMERQRATGNRQQASGDNHSLLPLPLWERAGVRGRLFCSPLIRPSATFSRKGRRDIYFFRLPVACCLLVVYCLLSVALLFAADQDATLMKAASMDAGKISASEKKLYEESIRTTKRSIARETLEVFYKDALDYYHQNRYEESLELLDKIYSIDPFYEDVRSLRETIRRLKTTHDFESKRGVLEEYMRKGNEARQSGQSVLAISHWKQALTIEPGYEPAKKKIQEVNHALAQKQFELGYLNYHHGELEEALDHWSNTLALDPSYKKQGLLMLMSKVELALQRERVTRLAQQGYEQFEQHNLENSLQSYEKLLEIEPRHEEARRMATKIRIQLGQVAFKEAHDASSHGLYAQAIKLWGKSIQYGYEVQRSQKSIQDVERIVKTPPKPPKQTVEASTTTVVANTPPPAAAPPPPATPADREGALAHYRQGLGAIKNKDFHRAVEELKTAAQLDPSNEHVYIALQRAEQEWNGSKSVKTP